MVRCNEGAADCNGFPGDGCETDLSTNMWNCSACGLVCARPNTTAACVSGRCVVASCAADHGDCNGDRSDGCESDLLTSVWACGACGRLCSLPNATAACSGGACSVSACATDFADCDGIPANGCEVNTGTDNAHCGACGTACPGGTVCAFGECRVPCASPLSPCRAAPYCVNTATDRANCGACGRVCSNARVAVNGCSAGACTVVRCAGGYGDCDGIASNGCETDLLTRESDCGACGLACGTGLLCAEGACVCPAGQRLTGMWCVDLAPRPLAPLSLGDVTQRRPTLRWALPAGLRRGGGGALPRPGVHDVDRDAHGEREPRAADG